MRKTWRLNDEAGTIIELQDYVISKYNVEWRIFNKGDNFPEHPDFKLHIAMGDDYATHFEIVNEKIVLEDSHLRELLSQVSKFKL